MSEKRKVATVWPKELGPPPEHGWVCFHCGKCCKTEQEAAIHFGKPSAYGEEMPPECIKLARKLIEVGFRKGYSPNITVNLRELE